MILRFSAVLLVLPVVVASASRTVSEYVHIVDISALSSAEIEAVYALPAVEAWAEFGNTTLLAGGEELLPVLGQLASRPAIRTLQAGQDDLMLAQLHGGHAMADGQVAEQQVAHFGRYSLLLTDGESVQPDAEVIPVPWNTIVIARADRSSLPAFRAGANAGLIGDAVNALDPVLYTGYIEGLVGFGTRYTHTSSFPTVTNWVASRFSQIGMSPTLEAYQISGKTRHNVIAELTGTVTPDDVYVVCGHFDSTSQNPSNFAPGADDNASGAGGVLAMAEALSGFEFDSTIRFIAFSGEEQGLVGSSAHVNKLISAGQLGRVKGVINMDMVAFLNTSRWDVLIEGRPTVSQAMMSLLSGLVSQYTSLVPFTSNNPFGSDHMPYINNGVNAVLTIEYQDSQNPNYHSTSDKFSTLTIPFATEILKLNIAAIATSAGVNGRSSGGGSAGVVENYGVGLGGTNIGSLSSTSLPNVGSTIFVDVSGFPNSPQVQVAMCRQPVNLPRLGGTLLVDLKLRFATLEAPLSGGATTVSFAIPNQLSLVGLSAYLQAGAPDPTQASGFALSHGMKLTIGQ